MWVGHSIIDEIGEGELRRSYLSFPLARRFQIELTPLLG